MLIGLRQKELDHLTNGLFMRHSASVNFGWPRADGNVRYIANNRAAGQHVGVNCDHSKAQDEFVPQEKLCVQGVPLEARRPVVAGQPVTLAPPILMLSVSQSHPHD